MYPIAVKILFSWKSHFNFKTRYHPLAVPYNQGTVGPISVIEIAYL